MNLPAVLYEDADVIVFDKPAGLLLSRDRWDAQAENLMDAIHRQLSPAIFNAHRLDRGTSGALVCTKNTEALRAVCRGFERRTIGKHYVALVRGSPAQSEFTLNRPIRPDPAHPSRMCTGKAGRPAVTVCHVVRAWRGYARIDAEPRTGRTHQIRVHLSSAGYPIVGDPLYGEGRGLFLSEIKRGYRHKGGPERPLLGRLALHCASLEFEHPVTGATLRVEAPLPHDFQVAFKYLDRFAPSRFEPRRAPDEAPAAEEGLAP